jgi:hypothetical protein
MRLLSFEPKRDVRERTHGDVRESWFAGVVETDTWYRPVHFPALCTMRPGTQVKLDKGTPLAQAIPFKREAWRSALQDNLHEYRDAHWTKKEYR